MFLKTLTLRGFKSFADPAVLEFEPGVTVVVGPNGSGKSNVVDAVAWVLGAQGPRTVRSAKMEDVIFAGSATRPALGRAEVSLTIDNSAGKLPTDLAEITITRTLFRSGESEYAINGAPCRLLDVQELLSDTGVGRQQHVIISQGQLDAILSARPEDRRAVIEEAAGVLKYRRRRERAERRLAATDENLERLFDLVREVKRQIRPLERQAAAARSHDELAGELHRLRLALAGEELRTIDARREAAGAQRAELQAAEAGWRATVTELDEETGRTTDELSARREADLSSSLGRVEGLVERARGLAGVLRERRRGLQAALDAAADADVVANLEAEAARVNAELAATGEESEGIAPERAALAAAEQAAAERLAAHGDRTDDGGPRPAAEAVAECRRAVDTLSRSLERDRADLAQVESRLLAGERRVAALGDEEIELSDRLDATEQDRHRLQAEVARAEAAHTEVTRNLDEAEEALRLAEQEHHRAEARADALERALDEARGAAGAELLAGVDGVVGTLLDLVEVDEGWEAALEAAAGGSLAAVVVSGSSAARHALDLLRGGEATGAVLALGAAAAPPSPPAPAGAEAVRAHVRARTGAADPAGLGALLDRLLADAVCTGSGWSAAIDLALARPDLVVVTRDGDRFSQTGWRVRAAGGVVTAALVEEARRRAVLAGDEAVRWASERSEARVALDARRAALADAVRADDRNEADHQGARAALARVAADRAARAAELDEVRLVRAELVQRIERDAARSAELQASLPALEVARAEEEEARRSALAARLALEEALAAATSRRSAFEVGVAALDERRRVLEERLAEIERRLAGHAEERRQAEANRSRLERDARAIDGLAGQVERVRSGVETVLAEQRDLHRRQIEAVRAGGARLEELRRRRSGAEHELAASRSRLQSVELELAESAVRRESVVETLVRELGASPEEAVAEPVPVLEGGMPVPARVEHLQAELERLGPVNPLALEELSGLNERHAFLEGQVEDVRRARRELQQVIRTLDEEIMRAFDAAFSDVSHHFGELVSTLFPGGTGRISLTDPERLLDTGVEVEVRPAGRNVRRLSLLSGGERSLVAMAFLFAVFRSRPSPFYLMDEVEAALDDVNLHRFLGLVHEFRDEAQLIIVSHQKRTMESGDALYGVTMAPGGSSKVVSQKVPRPAGDPEAGSGQGDRATLVGEPAVGSWTAATLAAANDVVVGLAIGIPVLVVAVGAGVALRFRGRGPASVVPPGEKAADVPTESELAAGAEATRLAEGPPAESPSGETPEPVAGAPAEAVTEATEEAPEAPTYRGRLGKARGLLAGYVGAIRSRGKIDATTWDELEEALIRADVGVGATDALLDDLRSRVRAGEIGGPDALLDALRADLVAALDAPRRALTPPGTARAARDGDGGDGDGDGRAVDVWLFVGVNGVGKTTTVGKVATRLTAGGTTAVLAAGDTFRAAAGEQLALWASRSGAEIVRGAEGGDPSSVVYDAVQRAAARGADVVLADTAGRLHNKANLIDELKKIRRVSDRPPGKVTEVLLVIDATTGQNGLAQAAVFTEAVDVTGVVLTKLDGTAKGGIVVAIQRELGLPVKLVGLGEGPGDLVDFDPAPFVDALF